MFTFNEGKDVFYKPKKISRARSLRVDEDVVIPSNVNEKVSGDGITIYPEFMEYCYSLEGCPKKLLFYLIFHHADLGSCEFTFNDQTIHEFRSYDKIVTNNRKTYTTAAIKSALRSLVKTNISVNIKRGKYMINPMIRIYWD